MKQTPAEWTGEEFSTNSPLEFWCFAATVRRESKLRTAFLAFDCAMLIAQSLHGVPTAASNEENLMWHCQRRVARMRS